MIPVRGDGWYDLDHKREVRQYNSDIFKGWTKGSKGRTPRDNRIFKGSFSEHYVNNKTLRIYIFSPCLPARDIRRIPILILIHISHKMMT